MLTREVRRKDITARLSTLTAYIRLNNKQGLTDANKEAEDFFCGLLNMILDASLGNMNRIQQDYPAIDLGDPEEALAVQVTSTNNHAKIQHTLDEFFGNDLDQTYNQLMVLIIGEKLKYRKPFKTKRRFHFDADRDVWDTATLCNEIMELSDEKQEEVIRYLDAKMDLSKLFPDIPEEEPAPAPAPAAVSLAPLVFLEKKLKYKLPTFVGFVGRDREIAELNEKLVAQNKKLIFITGLGGMGKTELAVEFSQRLKGCKVHFAHFAGSFRQTVSQNIALDIENLRRDEKRPEEEIYRDAMGVLEACGEDTVLIIDNADPPDERNFDLLRDETFEKLCAMKLRLVITTRASVPGGVRVDKMTDADMKKLLRQRKGDLSDEDADALIEAVEGHTMTLDLMARAMVGGWSPLTPAKLLEALRRNDLAASVSKAVSSDYNSAQQRIDEHLRTVFKLSGIPENAKQAMRCAALLPEAGMNADLFAGALPQDAQTALDDLADRAWLRVKDGVATIHPVVRLICFEELKPTDETCGAFLENLWAQYADTKYNADQYTQMAELFTSAAEKLDNKFGNWSAYGRKLWGVLGQNEKEIACAGMTLERRMANLPADHLDLADAYNDMGLAVSELRDHQRMAEYYGKALEIRQRVLDADHPDLARSYNNVGDTYHVKGDYHTALIYEEKALKIFRKIMPEDDLDLARSYNNVGRTYGELGDHRKELQYQEQALAILQKALPADHPDLARSYNNVGGTYGALGDHRKALEYMEQALSILQRALPADHPDLAQSYNNVGGTYSELGDHRKALEYKEYALAIFQKALPADHPDLAQSYNNVGGTYSDLGDHRKALEYLEQALAILQRALPADHPDLAQSYNNVGKIYSDLSDHQKALEYEEKALAIWKKALPADHPDLARSYNNLAMTWFCLGNRKQALEYMAEALRIMEKSLPPKHPDIKKIKKNMEAMKRMGSMPKWGFRK